MNNSGIKDEKDEHPVPYPPEPENSELTIKPFCECHNCTHWTQSADWSTPAHLKFENQSGKVVNSDKKVHVFLRSPKAAETVPKIISYECTNEKRLDRQATAKVLVHGETIPPPVAQVSECYFSENIQSSLEKLKYKYSMPIQAFAWPTILRQMNMFLISGNKSGKTMSYLPAVCTFINEPGDKYSDLAKYKGPLVIIVCPNSKQCEEIYDLVKKLHMHSKPKVSIVTYPLTNIHNTDILITIPEALISCIQSRVVNFKRLCHLIFEDASNLLVTNRHGISDILRLANEMLGHRVQKSTVQLIVTSEKWTDDLKLLYKSIYVTPVVCFGNTLEAAIYGNIQFELKFLMLRNKMNYLKEILEDNFQVYKTVVICNDSEVAEVSNWLNDNEIATISLSDGSDKDEIERCELEWSRTRGGLHKVLLCTDFVFDSLLCITDAVWLINYSFASTWTRFTKRFSAMSSHYKSPWESNEEIQCKSFILIDETCEKQMGRILHLMSRLGKELPLNYQQYADRYKYNKEIENINNKVKLCERLKMFGICPNSLCDQRHILSPDLDVSQHLPKIGKVVFKVLLLKSPARYVVQLIEHVDENGRVVEINNDNLKKPLIYAKDEDKKSVEELKLGHFCAHCEYTLEGEEYRLCHIVNISNDKTVEVKLSTGSIVQTFKSKLYELPSRLKRSVCEIYLSNVIPRFNDEVFSGRSVFVTMTSLESKDYKNILLTADVDLQLDNTLWVHNVVQIIKVDGKEAIKLDLIKYLKKILEVVDLSKDQIASLRELCETYDIEVPVCQAKPAAKNPAVKKDTRPQTAFLDDNVNEVILASAVYPDEFYVRLVKFQRLLDNLEDEIKENLANPLLEKNVAPIVGKYYLAPDPSGRIYSRALLLKMQDGKALCFYVDYGDEGVVNTSDLKTLPSKLLLKLPFQAIQCRLYGILPVCNEWSVQATDVLYNYMFEPDSDIFRSLFVRVCDKQNIDGKETYSVLLKDGYGSKNVLINRIMLDCGFAKESHPHSIEDFDVNLPEYHEEHSQESDLEDDDFPPEEIDDIDDNLDCEILNLEDFLGMVGLSHMIRKTPQITDQEVKSTTTKAIAPVANNSTDTAQAVEKASFLTPEIFWTQDEKIVRIKIKLIGVQKYKTKVFPNRIFLFSTKLNEKQYEVKFYLYKKAQISKHRALGQDVQIVLNKEEAVEWVQLTATTKKMRNIHYEVPNEKEKPKRRFLQLDITDDESDVDDCEIMTCEVSDLDSEYDRDVESSSDD